MKTYKIFILFSFILLFSNCSKEESEDNCIDELKRLTDIVAERQNELSENQTVASCNAFKTAYKNLYEQGVKCGYKEQYQAGYDATLILDCNAFSKNSLEYNHLK